MTMEEFLLRHLAALAPDLFSLCREFAWPQLEKSTAVLYIQSGRVEFISSEARMPQLEATFQVPLRPVIDLLREQVFATNIPIRRDLSLPPVAVSSRLE